MCIVSLCKRDNLLSLIVFTLVNKVKSMIFAKRNFETRNVYDSGKFAGAVPPPFGHRATATKLQRNRIVQLATGRRLENISLKIISEQVHQKIKNPVFHLL